MVVDVASGWSGGGVAGGWSGGGVAGGWSGGGVAGGCSGCLTNVPHTRSSAAGQPGRQAPSSGGFTASFKFLLGYSPALLTRQKTIDDSI